MNVAHELVAEKDVVDVDALVAERDAYRRALESIRERAQAMTLDVPMGRPVPRSLATGHLLTLSGLAEAALEE